MAGVKRNKVKREEDRAKISRMYRSGYTQKQIAEEIGISQQTVSRDLNVVKGRWMKDADINFDQMRAEQLAKIDNLEAELWGAWRRSVREKKVQSRASDSGSGKFMDRVSLESRDGNSAFTNGIAKCIEMRCRMLGLESPVITATVDISDPIKIYLPKKDSNDDN